jgi:hypothetical protein
MTGEEFMLLPSITADFSGLFLRDFFRHCDTLRFSGVDVRSEDVTALLDQVRDFVGKVASGDAGSPGAAGETAGSGELKAGPETGEAV